MRLCKSCQEVELIDFAEPNSQYCSVCKEIIKEETYTIKITPIKIYDLDGTKHLLPRPIKQKIHINTATGVTKYELIDGSYIDIMDSELR